MPKVVPAPALAVIAATGVVTGRLPIVRQAGGQGVHVEDADAVIARAAELGATVQRPAEDQFYGDRDGHIIDPFGHGWTVASQWRTWGRRR
jgi:glyoxalase/bleomycin resistance protein/dioxygenase superfamily protein